MLGMFTKIRKFVLHKSGMASRTRIALALAVLLPATTTFPRSSIAADKDILLGCTSSALDSQRIPLDGARIVAAAQTPMALDPASTTPTPMPKEVASITLNSPSEVQPGQLLI